MSAVASTQQAWSIADLGLDTIDVNLVQDDEFLLLTLVSASFVEILADIYNGNMMEQFTGDAELVNWLQEDWQREESMHGEALKAYVHTVWPAFNWERAHRAFYSDYQRLCTIEQLESDAALELMARCVVETGTSTLYRALKSYVREPVLEALLNRIMQDEFSHYSKFRRHFLYYNSQVQLGAGAVSAVIWRRLREVHNQDAYIAFKYAYSELHADVDFKPAHWKHFRRTTQRLARRHYPFSLAVRMLLQPLPMANSIKLALRWPLTGMAYMLTHS